MKIEKLLKIVKTWKIKERPEYRGFRCGNCQRYIYKAWHFQVNGGGYKCPVHFCDDCRIHLKLPKTVYKKFSCKKCGKNIRKAYHVWSKKGKILSEIHFCKKCGKKYEKGNWNL